MYFVCCGRILTEYEKLYVAPSGYLEILISDHCSVVMGRRYAPQPGVMHHNQALCTTTRRYVPQPGVAPHNQALCHTSLYMFIEHTGVIPRLIFPLITILTFRLIIRKAVHKKVLSLFTATDLKPLIGWTGFVNI